MTIWIKVSLPALYFLNYSKAFDRINYNKFMDKLLQLDVPKTIRQWFFAFLSNRTQYVQIDQVHIQGAFPQGSIMGMEGFCVQIDDLKPPLPMYKYVDDSTIFETLAPKHPRSSLQSLLTLP